MNSTLEAIGQALFRRWFVDFEFPNEKGKPYKSSGGEMVGTELGKMPRGWRVGAFKDCCKRIENGGTPKRSEPKYWEPEIIQWLTSGEVRQSIVTSRENFISNEGLANSSAKLWPSGTTVVALYGATAGQVCFLAQEMCATQACCGLIPSENMRLYIYLRASLSVEAFERQTRGSAQQNLSQQIVADFPTTIPDYGVLERFDKAVWPIFDKWISNLSESHTLAVLRDALLPKLMSGEIRVNI